MIKQNELYGTVLVRRHHTADSLTLDSATRTVLVSGTIIITVFNLPYWDLGLTRMGTDYGLEYGRVVLINYWDGGAGGRGIPSGKYPCK